MYNKIGNRWAPEGLKAKPLLQNDNREVAQQYMSFFGFV
jgi:hypothetical protein